MTIYIITYPKSTIAQLNYTILTHAMVIYLTKINHHIVTTRQLHQLQLHYIMAYYPLPPTFYPDHILQPVCQYHNSTIYRYNVHIARKINTSYAKIASHLLKDMTKSIYLLRLISLRASCNVMALYATTSRKVN